MDKSSYFNDESIAMKAKFEQLKTQHERDVLVAKFVFRLKQYGLTTEEIKSVLNVEVVNESQCSRAFISQTEAFKAAVAKALGEKR